MNDESLRAQINALIRDEIQETVNEYIEDKEVREKKKKEPGQKIHSFRKR